MYAIKRIFKRNTHNSFFKALAGFGRSLNRLYENRNHDIYSNGEVTILNKIAKMKPSHIIDGGGYNDWFLPSFEELNKLYTNKTYLGMSEGWYWSSTESDNYSIWFLDFKFGFKELARHNHYRVRAIRMF